MSLNSFYSHVTEILITMLFMYTVRFMKLAIKQSIQLRSRTFIAQGQMGIGDSKFDSQSLTCPPLETGPRTHTRIFVLSFVL